MRTRTTSQWMCIAFVAVFALSTGAAAAQFSGPSNDDQMGPPSGPMGQMGSGPRPPREMNAEQRLKRMTKDLKLTGDQQAKIKPILEKEDNEMAALRSDSELSPQVKFERFREIRDLSLDEIRPLLNESQKHKLDSMQRQAERRQPPPGGFGGPENER